MVGGFENTRGSLLVSRHCPPIVLTHYRTITSCLLFFGKYQLHLVLGLTLQVYLNAIGI